MSFDLSKLAPIEDGIVNWSEQVLSHTQPYKINYNKIQY